VPGDYFNLIYFRLKFSIDLLILECCTFKNSFRIKFNRLTSNNDELLMSLTFNDDFGIEITNLV